MSQEETYTDFKSLVEAIKSAPRGEIITPNKSFNVLATSDGFPFAEEVQTKTSRRKNSNGGVVTETKVKAKSTYKKDPNSRFERSEGLGSDVIIRCDNNVCVITNGKSANYISPESVPGHQILPIVKEGEITQDFLQSVKETSTVYQQEIYAINVNNFEGLKTVVEDAVQEFNVTLGNFKVAHDNLIISMGFDFGNLQDRNISMRQQLREELNSDTEKIIQILNQSMRDCIAACRQYNDKLTENYTTDVLSSSI